MMDPSRPPVIKSGWLQFFRSCMSMLFTAVCPTGMWLLPANFVSNSVMVLFTNASLNSFCLGTICA